MRLPELFGSYLLHHQLARGGISEVFLAQTTGEFIRLCAVKRVRPELATLPDFERCFRQDARLLVQLIHGNLVQVLEVGTVEEHPYVAMELLDGVELEELVLDVPQSGPLPPELALYVGLELCEGLSYLHRRRCQELQVTSFPAAAAWPLQVMLTFDGVVKLVDLGACGSLRLAQEPQARQLGRPGYAVPEVLRGQPLDLKSDLFALGTMLWELLAGRRLLVGDASYPARLQEGSWRAPLLSRKDLAGDIIRLVAELLEPEPQRRPASMEEVRRRLVEGLRRLAPAYGSARLSGLLWERFPRLVGRSEELVQEALQRNRTEQESARGVRTNTYGNARQVERQIAAPLALQPGDVIPGTRYRLVRTLGRGGFAEVHAAQHIDLDRQVAIKILSPELAGQAAAIAQFRLEARACSRIGHPNIVEVMDFGELPDGRFFFAMELLEGETLAAELDRRGPLSASRAVGIFRQLTKALAAAHAHSIIHRDLKPDNIMLLSRDGRPDFVKVLDFGVMAFDNKANPERAGTMGYMAPEQCSGAAPSPGIDIYALGICLYESLSGVVPYVAQTLEEFMALQAELPPPALRSHVPSAELHPALERLVHRALERDPAARHLSMADFEAELLAAQREAGLQSYWDDLPPPGKLRAERQVAERPRPRRRWPIYGAVAAAGLAAAVGATLALSGPSAPEQVPAALNSPAVAAAPQAQPLAEDQDRELEALVRQAAQAAGQGRFTHPPGQNALEFLRQVEERAPGSSQAEALRRQIARALETAAGRLTQAGLAHPARALHAEASLFQLPAREQLKQRAAAARPDPSLPRLAWLLSQVQLAVSEGRYLKPPEENALHYLTQLKQLDPSGERSKQAQQVMTASLRGRADSLWKQGDREQAQPLYRMVLILQPEDALARARSEPDPAPAPQVAVRGQASRTAAAGPADRERARALVAEGKKLLDQGQLAEAQQRFQSAIQVHTQAAPAYTGLATVAFEQARYPRAVELAQQSLAAAPRNIETLLLLGDAQYKLLRMQEALKAWQQVLELDPKNRQASRRMARLRPLVEGP